MHDDISQQDLRHKRANARRTAWLLGFIALAIFATFIGSAVMGR
ncbi:MAG: hypothetical protein OQJ84_10695 [Xanthomonadales bacterium]|nr:hypothetical protein [Xanthomonadales bacterium]